MFHLAAHDRASSPPVSTLRPPRFKRPSNPPSQQTPPSAQRPPVSQQPSVLPSSIPRRRQPNREPAHDDDPVEDFSEYEVDAASGAEAPSGSAQSGSQNAFQRMISSQATSGSQRPPGSSKKLPKWSDEEDSVLIQGVRMGWPSFDIARELEKLKGPVHRTESAIRGRKKALKEKLNLESPVMGPKRLRVEKRQRWNPNEISILQRGVRSGLDAATLHQQHFSYRSLRSVEHKVQKRKRLSKEPAGDGSAQSKTQRAVPSGKAPSPNVAEDVEDQTMLDDTQPMCMAPDDDAVEDDMMQDEATPVDAAPDDTHADAVLRQVEEYPAYSAPAKERECPALDSIGASSTLNADFDFANVPTAFVKLPSRLKSTERPGRLRHPTPAPNKSRPAAQIRNTRATSSQNQAAQYESESDKQSSTEPVDRRKGLFDDWEPDQRWLDALRKAGGDEAEAKRHLGDMNLTTRMFDAILHKDDDTIRAIRAERRQMELRWAIEDGRARRIRPRETEGMEDADDEVLREDDWEILIEDGERDDLPPKDDWDEYYQEESEEDMVRDRVLEEVEDDDDDQDQAPPGPADHRTPIQAMRAVVLDAGLPTPLPTSEKFHAFDSKQPASSFPNAAESVITITTASDRSKRQRRRTRNATTRRQSGGVRSARNSDSRSMNGAATTPAPLDARGGADQAKSYGVEPDNPFMTIVKNAHIPPPPRRRQEAARRRGTPSPPACFASDDESDASSEVSE